MDHDNIVALSTPPGEGGIGILRLSGESVLSKVEEIFMPYKPQNTVGGRPAYSLTLGWITDAEGNKIDQVLLGVMKSPHSYTGDDVVEINCHGGSLPVRKCLERCLEIGIRMAEPGEFTRRAFLNGRMDLSQAEAVIDVIRAKTDRGLKLSMQQLEGVISRYIAELEDALLRVNAMVEASIDFPDEVGDLDVEEARGILEDILKTMDRYLAAGQKGQIYRDGAKIAICGKPNVGKSSLLNALIRKDKAIVTEIPGTTRDVIEEYINLKGIPVRLMDTAGIHITDDFVEKIGIEKSKEAIERADLVIFLLDIASGITREDIEIFEKINPDKVLVLVNKEDLEEKKIPEEDLASVFKNVPVIRGSVKQEIGIEEMEDAIEKMLLKSEYAQDGLEIMMNLRQQDALLKSRAFVESALAGINDTSLDCLGVDLGGALSHLGEITGKTFHEELIDKIFHDFCIGK